MLTYLFVLCHDCIYDLTGERGRGEKYWFVSLSPAASELHQTCADSGVLITIQHAAGLTDPDQSCAKNNKTPSAALFRPEQGVTERQQRWRLHISLLPSARPPPAAAATCDL